MLSTTQVKKQPEKKERKPQVVQKYYVHRVTHTYTNVFKVYLKNEQKRYHANHCEPVAFYNLFF